jgi:hypothetical protein
MMEGPMPRDWTGYHTGKHGVVDRLVNLKGEQGELNMDEFFFKDKYRWVRSEYKDANGKVFRIKNPDGSLRPITEFEFDSFIRDSFKEKIPVKLDWLFDSEKFKTDAVELLEKFKSNPVSNVWQGRFYAQSGEVDPLQNNVDFRQGGYKFRIAVDAESGRLLNFFNIDESRLKKCSLKKH